MLDKINRYFIAVFIISLFTNSLYSQEAINSWRKVADDVQSMSKIESIPVDNIHIQTYKGRKGIWVEVKSGQNISNLAKKHGSTVEEINSLNELSINTKKVFSRSWLFIPHSKEYLKEMDEQGIERVTVEVPRGEFIWPVEGIRITSRLGNRWGRLHPGLDIATPSGTMVVSAMQGEVIHAEFMGAYGYVVVISHGDKYITRYAHLSNIIIKKGDKVRKGQVIALSGSTGRSTGPHLHFEVRYNNVILDPEYFLPDFKESMEAIVQSKNNNINNSAIKEN